LRQRFSLIRQPAQEEEYAAEIGIFSTSAEYWSRAGTRERTIC
jgi:hypothetical protein